LSPTGGLPDAQMPSKDYRIWINDTIYIVVDLVMIRGRLLSFVVRLMWIEMNKTHNVVRYDTAHGTPHRDTLGKHFGLLRKDWYPGLTHDLVLQRAIADCKLNYENYIAQFKEN
jgi:hypothetical protein